MTELDLINEMESQQAWSKARRKAAIQRVLCAIQDCSFDLIPFEEARQLLHLNQKICRGLQEIELDKIRGSVGRYQDFTSAFLPRREHMRQRWQRVRSAKATKGLPPVDLYKLGQVYFVVDGNHRVSIARMEGDETIEAYVCEYISIIGLSGGMEMDEEICNAEYAEFLGRTKLHPEEAIVFTVPGQYIDIECQIESIRQFQEKDRGETVSIDEAATLWYQETYSPIIQEIRDSRVIELFSSRTEADLFMWMWRREPELQAYCTQNSNLENGNSSFNRS